MKLSVLISLLFMSVVSAGPLSLTPMQKASDFYALTKIMETGYAMLEYKKTNILKEDYLQIKKRYFFDISKTRTDAEYYTLLFKYIHEFKDGHLYLDGVFNLDLAMLPVDFRYLEGKVVVSDIYITGTKFGIGDELIEFDGKPTASVLEELAPYYTGGGSAGHQLKGILQAIGYRSSNRLMPADGSSAVLKLKSRKTGSEYSDTEAWVIKKYSEIYSRGFRLPARLHSFYENDGNWSFDPLYVQTLIRKQLMGSPVAGQRLEDNLTAEIILYTSGSKQYKIGRIRVPDYDGWAIESFDTLLSGLADCDGLILDQRDNPGGYIDLCQNLVSRFLDAPLTNLEFSVPLNRHWLNNVELKLKLYTQAQYPADQIAVVKTCRDTMYANANAGKKMSDFIPFFYASKLQPAELKFLKPVLVLIDSGCFSCGDLVPASFRQKDWMGKLKLFGETTGAGGGNVVQAGPLPLSETMFHVTASLARWGGKNIIENNGISPDVVSPYTISDLYSEAVENKNTYLEKACAELVKMIN
ncbi:MAG: S41 family peptidase [Candidatus Wallbacteria bacterium]|nr:S41 family peptidase [Candidatus Wallbacteria bacterium]